MLTGTHSHEAPPPTVAVGAMARQKSGTCVGSDNDSIKKANNSGRVFAMFLKSVEINVKILSQFLILSLHTARFIDTGHSQGAQGGIGRGRQRV
jgi:hypothetical protein